MLRPIHPVYIELKIRDFLCFTFRNCTSTLRSIFAEETSKRLLEPLLVAGRNVASPALAFHFPFRERQILNQD